MSVRVDLYNEDCIGATTPTPSGMAGRLADNSVRHLVTSIPFGALFSYSHKREDIGNCRDGVEFVGTQFGLNMRFFFHEVARVLSPGCVAAIHVQQLDTTQVQHGHQGIRDFRGAIIDMARKHGLQPHGEVAIPKNPQRIAQVRKLHRLLFVTGRRDSRLLAPANNDFVLFFKKPGDDGAPVHGLYDKKLNPRGQFSQEDWIKWAHGTWADAWADEDRLLELEGYREVRDAYLQQQWRDAPIWDDIIETDVLDGHRGARETDEEKHVCPLQLSVIRRCLLLYTNPGDLVVDPFMGIGSTAWVCIELGRACVGFELKESYHAMSLRNTAKARAQFESPRAGADDDGQAALSFEAAS